MEPRLYTAMACPAVVELQAEEGQMYWQFCGMHNAVSQWESQMINKLDCTSY